MAITAPPAQRHDAVAPDLPWHSLPGDDVAARLGVDPRIGLNEAGAHARRAQYGANVMPRPKRRPGWLRFVDQFRSTLVLVLLGAAVLALAVGDVKDVAVIAVVVLLNAVLGFVQEHRAEASVDALERMLVTRARVRRDGVVSEIAAEELVPGDVVLLESGDRVPADGRFVTATELEIDEAAFTGESLPVQKHVGDGERALDAGVPLAERATMGYLNTSVTRGRGVLIVTATGAATEVGRLATMLGRAESPVTPLQRQIADLGKRLTLVAAAAVTLVFALGFARDTPVGDKLMNAVALAVAAIPEGLPAVLTVTLAVGTSQLAKRRAIVKRLASVETLGSTSVICTDKTGTLTLNQMTARVVATRGRLYAVDGGGEHLPDAAPLLLAAAACNDGRLADDRAVGDPTETALLTLAANGGLDLDALAARHPRVAEVPFESSRKYMATFHSRPGDAATVDVFAKGAPDVLLTRCSRVAGADGDLALDESARADIVAVQEALAQHGLRVLAVASGDVATERLGTAAALDDLVDDLRLEGLVGIADPPRPEARDAIARCRAAGITVKMITGDHAVTATAIARELGIEGDTVTGRDLDGLSREELGEVAQRAGVFARVAPEHKLALVEALQERGHVVAMTGDGVNDAPALKRADIGVAMGITGTDVSKEAATMVLTDDNFATIVRAVEGGRAIYDNIVKFVAFQLSTNLGAILTIVVASLLSWPATGSAFFAPLAVLWVNLIMDGPPAMALGVDPPGPHAMERPPRRRDEHILDRRRFLRLLSYGVVMAAGTLAVYRFAAGTDPSPVDAARAATMALTTFVFFQVFNVHNARFPDESVLGRHVFRNGKLWLALGLVVALQVFATQAPALQRLVTDHDVHATLSATDWLSVVAIASSILWIEELRKFMQRVRCRHGAGARVAPSPTPIGGVS